MIRLQFRHHSGVFNSREEAISFLDGLVNNEIGTAPIGESKMGEPILVVYKDETDKKHAILAIGKNEGGTGVPYQYIDADFMLSRIENAEDSINDINDSIDEIKSDVAEITDKVNTIEHDMIKEIIINDLPADVQDNVAKLVLGAKDIKLTDYAKADDPKDALHETDNINKALGKLESKSDNNDSRLKELEKIQPDEITIIKTAKDNDNIFLSTNLAIKEVTDGKSANFKAVYQLVDGKGNRLGNDIIIYKDSHLKGVELKKDDKGRATIMQFTYVDENGEDKTVDINVADFLQEAEFKTGLTVIDGEVSVKRDPSSEDFFAISDDGLKVSGINDAIATKVKEETDRAVAKENILEKQITTESEKTQESITTAKDELNNTIKVEEVRAIAAENALDSKIEENVDSLKVKIADEVKRANTTEAALSNALTDAKNTLATAINNEITRATNAETVLNTKIGTEDKRIIEEAKTNARELFVASNAKIADEATRAQAKENELETLITANKTTTDQRIKDAVIEAKAYADKQDNVIAQKLQKATVKPVAPITATVTDEGTELGLSIEDNKVLSVVNQKLSTTLSLAYDPETWMLKLLGVNDKPITEISVKTFVKTGLIKEITIRTGENNVKYLVIKYINADGTEDSVEIAVSELFSPYIASNGIEIKEENGKANLISVKVNPDGDGKFLTLGNNGLGLNGISDEINTAKTELANSIAAVSANVDSLEKRMSGDATVDGSVAHKVADSKAEIKSEFISKTVTDITTETAAGQTLLRKIGTGTDAELYVSNNASDMIYDGKSLASALDDMLEKINGLNASMNAIADRLDKIEESLKSVTIDLNGTENEIKIEKVGTKYTIGFADNAIFGQVATDPSDPIIG